jgi:hypothetical protein
LHPLSGVILFTDQQTEQIETSTAPSNRTACNAVAQTPIPISEAPVKLTSAPQFTPAIAPPPSSSPSAPAIVTIPPPPASAAAPPASAIIVAKLRIFSLSAFDINLGWMCGACRQCTVGQQNI